MINLQNWNLRKALSNILNNYKRYLKCLIEHNREHYIEIKIFGRELKPCARCFGMWLGFLILAPILFTISHFYTFDFRTIFLVSWLFAFPAIIDWITANVGFRNGSNKVRFITGFLLGTGIATYLFLLPASLIFRLITLILYEAVFAGVRIAVKYHRGEFYIPQKIPKATPYACSSASCCLCPSSCFSACFSVCCGLMILTLACCACCCIPYMCQKNE